MRLRLILLALLAVGLALGQSPHLRSNDGKDLYLGNLNSNQFDVNSVANPFGQYGSKYSPLSINNQFGTYGSRYSPYSPSNPYAVTPPKIVTPTGQYLGNLGGSRYAPNSTSNPYGRYGSRYSPTSITNPYGTFGSRYSPSGVSNPYGLGTGLGPEPTPVLPALPKLLDLWSPE